MQYGDTTLQSLAGPHTLMQYSDTTVENLFAHTL